MSDLEFYGKAVLALIGVLAVLGVIIVGVILMFRQKHQQNLALTPYDPKGAFRKTFKEYIVKELIETLLGACKLFCVNTDGTLIGDWLSDHQIR